MNESSDALKGSINQQYVLVSEREQKKFVSWHEFMKWVQRPALSSFSLFLAPKKHLSDTHALFPRTEWIMWKVSDVSADFVLTANERKTTDYLKMPDIKQING